MKVYGDIERVNLSTGERFRRVVGDGESRLESCCDQHTRIAPRRKTFDEEIADAKWFDEFLRDGITKLKGSRSMIRAKFTVTKSSVYGSSGATGPHVSKCYRDGKETDVPSREITMSAVYGGSEENKSFAAATPSGTITFTLSNPDVAESFQPGETYYVDFTPAG